jgi:hypothetical protein
MRSLEDKNNTLDNVTSFNANIPSLIKECTIEQVINEEQAEIFAGE